MAIMIMVVFVLGLAYEIYRSGRRALRPTPSNSVLTRLFNAEHDRAGNDPDSAAQAREADLSRQLLDGHLDRRAYQLAMAGLAQADASRPDGAP